MTSNSFNALKTFSHGGRDWEYFDIQALSDRFDVARLPFSLRVLLENLLRNEDGVSVRAADIEALAGWDAKAEPSKEIAFAPARVVMQDFTGVPAVVDLAAMRDAMGALGGDPQKINPLVPAELVIDHSVQVDSFGAAASFARNAELEFDRNHERYSFLKWGQGAFDGFAVVPPDTGIVHQVNVEYLSRVVFKDDESGRAWLDTVVGTDSHTTMINGLGVLGWGVGGIEAEAAMLGQAMPMLIPRVVGVKLEGKLPEAATATDLVLTLTEQLRAHGVVGKFVEFHGDGLASLPLADRATIGNMSPEFGSTCAIFPVDAETLRYLRFTGRDEDHVQFVEAYARAQGLFHEPGQESPVFSEELVLDLSTVVPSIAGPKRPQDRVSLTDARGAYEAALTARAEESGGTALKEAVAVKLENGAEFDLRDGAVVIAAITSCTNTSNPSVMVGAGLLARNAVAKGLTVKPWVKTSLAPGSLVVTSYLDKGDLTKDLDALGFNLVGYGCTTCIGNSGPLPAEISQAVQDGGLDVSAVLSGNRNFEGRINPDVTMNWLASPPLVVAYALAGTMEIDFYSDPIGQDADGNDVMLADIWPSPQDVAAKVEECLASDMFRSGYAGVFEGDERWQGLQSPTGDRFEWDKESTYIRQAPYFDDLQPTPAPTEAISGARVLALLGDSVTTDHISPAGSIRKDGPAGRWLQENGVAPVDFNSYGSRRGNHEVMVRGTFANIRLRNLLAPGTEGGVTLHQPTGEEMSIYDAAIKYEQEGVPLVVLAGSEYGSGSSRDWAAKGTRLLGVRAVIARSYERIHRSNLVGMGVLPLQFLDGDSAESLGLTGQESFDIPDIGDGDVPETLTVRADGKEFKVRVRIDTPKEAEYFRHGGILPYVLRNLASAS